MKAFALILSASLTLLATAAMAQSSETTTTTTTIETTSAPAGFVLPGGVRYTVVNPTTSVVVGDYAVGQTLSPGYYLVEQSSGRVTASVDDAGRIVAFTSVPSVVPQRFKVVNNQLVYFNNEYAFRRSQLENQVAAEYAAGRLTNEQVKELREDLSEIASLEGKKRGDMTYSKSTMKSIERKLATVQSELSHDIAETNERKAKIGIRVN